MRRLYPFLISIFLAPSAFAQHSDVSMQSNVTSQSFPLMGVAVDVLGLFFGTYSLGVTTMVTPHIQLGLTGRYYDTHSVSPEVEGGQGELMARYFFSSIEKSGFFLGASGGYESVSILKDEGTGWKREEDAIWAVTPGYKWTFDTQWHLLLGLQAGHNLGETQLSPEVEIIYLF